MGAISRRRLIFGTFAALGSSVYFSEEILVQTGKSMGLCEPAPTSPEIEKTFPDTNALSITDAYRDIYGRKQYAFIGDSDHSDKRIRQDFFYTDDNIELMAKQGIKHLCLERDRDSQSLIDAMASGEKTPDEYANDRKYQTNNVSEEIYKEGRRQFARAMQKCKKLGIQVHCVDEPDEELKPNAWNVGGDFIDFHDNMCQSKQGVTESVVGAFAMTNLPKMFTARKEAIEFNKIRDNDLKRAETIKSLVGDEKTVILFGNAHFHPHSKSFKDILGNENATHVKLVGDKRRAKTFDKSRSDYIHFIEEKSVYRALQRRTSRLAIQSPMLV